MILIVIGDYGFAVGLELCALGSGELGDLVSAPWGSLLPTQTLLSWWPGQSLHGQQVIHTRKSKVGTSSHLGWGPLRCWNSKELFKKDAIFSPPHLTLLWSLLDSLWASCDAYVVLSVGGYRGFCILGTNPCLPDDGRCKVGQLT